MFDSENRECGHVRSIARREFLLRAARWCVAIVGICLVACGAYAGYGIWRNKHLESQAHDFAARGDMQSAVLAARHLLQIDRSNLTATRVIAELADQSGRPEAIEWRKAVAALEPKNSENHVALATTALRFGQVELAARSLDCVESKLRDTARIHQLAGAIALGQHKLEAAEEHFAAALEQDRGNDQIALNLATIRLASSRAGAAESAREALTRLTEQKAVRTAALRSLAADAVAHRDQLNEDRWSAALVQEPSASFADFLLRLEATQSTDRSETAMAECQQRAKGNSANAVDLIAWMNRHELAREALAWSNSLDTKVREAQPVPLAIAESLSCMSDWQGLLDFVQNTSWGKEEPVRLAIESHALRHAKSGAESSAEAGAKWRAALNAARGHVDQLATMATLADGWGYRAQAADAWWTIANGNAKTKEALGALQRLYKIAHDSRGLLRVAKRAFELNPEDLVAENNCASLGLLLNADSASHRLAAKLHDEHPDNAVFAATYAFSLHLQGKTADALRVLERLREAQLRQPALAVYYVMMLAENGNTERALSFLPAARQASLLPEEQQLLTDAARKLNTRS